MSNFINRIENSILKVIVTGLFMIISWIIGMATFSYLDQELRKRGKLSYKKDGMELKY